MAERPAWYPPDADYYRGNAVAHCRAAAKALITLADGLEARSEQENVPAQLKGVVGRVIEAHAILVAAGILVEKACDEADRDPFPRLAD